MRRFDRPDYLLDVGAVHPHERVVAAEDVGHLEGGREREAVVDLGALPVVEHWLGCLAQARQEAVLMELEEADQAVEDDLALGRGDDRLARARDRSLGGTDVEVNEIA